MTDAVAHRPDLTPGSDRPVLAVAQRYERFLHYIYPVAQNIPRRHGVAKHLMLTDLLSMPQLMYDAAKTGQISRVQLVDSRIATIRNPPIGVHRRAGKLDEIFP